MHPEWQWLALAGLVLQLGTTQKHQVPKLLAGARGPALLHTRSRLRCGRQARLTPSPSSVRSRICMREQPCTFVFFSVGKRPALAQAWLLAPYQKGRQTHLAWEPQPATGLSQAALLPYTLSPQVGCPFVPASRPRVHLTPPKKPHYVLTYRSTTAL